MTEDKFKESDLESEKQDQSNNIPCTVCKFIGCMIGPLEDGSSFCSYYCYGLFNGEYEFDKDAFADNGIEVMINNLKMR